MAMGTDKKLYVAVGVLAVLGGALLLQKKQAKQVTAAHSAEARSAELPDIKIKQEDADKIDKITIVRPKDDKKAADDEHKADGVESRLKREGVPVAEDATDRRAGAVRDQQPVPRAH